MGVRRRVKGRHILSLDFEQLLLSFGFSFVIEIWMSDYTFCHIYQIFVQTSLDDQN